MKKLKVFESSDELSLDMLQRKYPKINFTMDEKSKDRYFVRADIETQDGKTEYLGALKGSVSKDEGLKFLDNVAKKNYDKYY